MENEIDLIVDVWKNNIEEVDYLSSQGNTCSNFQVPISHMKKLLDELDRLQEQNRWIPVTEKLPNINNYDKEYLVKASDDVFLRVATFEENNWYIQYGDDSFESNFVTYWKEIELPEDK